MRKILTLAVLVLLIILASCDPSYSYTFKEEGRQVALVYGLDYIENGQRLDFSPSIPGDDALDNTVFDASEMGYVMKSNGYDLERTTDAEQTFIENAEIDDIDNDISGISLTEEDTLLFYFSGHGLIDEDTSYIVSHIYGDQSNIPSSILISPDWLFSSLRATGAGQIIVILDICNSGGFVADRSHEVDGLPENYTDDWPSAFSLSWERFFNRNGPDNPYPNIHVISAAGKDEESYESDSIQNGYFTYFMLRSLGYDHGNDVLTASTSADENKDGIVTLSELYSDTFARFEASYLKSYESETITTQDTYAYYPHITGGSGDPIVFYLD
jgi:hypothetical protein